MTKEQLSELNSLFSFIDFLYYKEQKITSEEAEDLIKTISWIEKEEVQK